MRKIPDTAPRQRATNNIVDARFVIGTAAPGTCPDITVGDDVAVVDGIGEILPFDLARQQLIVGDHKQNRWIQRTQRTPARTRSQSMPDENWQDCG